MFKRQVPGDIQSGGDQMGKIRVAIAGVGNCASSLVQGVEYYRLTAPNSLGLMHHDMCGYKPYDIEFVAAFDIDSRKVGRPLSQAIFAKPNCTQVFCADVNDNGVVVQMGKVLDGVADHMRDYPEDRTFIPANLQPVDVEAVLRETKPDVLLCYLPVGSEHAVKFYAKACLNTGVSFINCIPVFIVSNKEWADQFTKAGIPVIGDDVKSQLGATILHRTLMKLFQERGIKIERTYQLNTGGNTDFLNMLNRSRLKSKKISKTEAVQSTMETRLKDENIHIGPSDYVPFQNDNKVCFIRIEGRMFGEVPMHMELRLSVEDSPNSAGTAIDAIRLIKVARDRGIAGPLWEPSAYLMKHPPIQMDDRESRIKIDDFLGIQLEEKELIIA
jgi:myo-inositol-1-phosphate synthase